MTHAATELMQQLARTQVQTASARPTARVASGGDGPAEAVGDEGQTFADVMNETIEASRQDPAGQPAAAGDGSASPAVEGERDDEAPAEPTQQDATESESLADQIVQALIGLAEHVESGPVQLPEKVDPSNGPQIAAIVSQILRGQPAAPLVADSTSGVAAAPETVPQPKPVPAPAVPQVVQPAQAASAADSPDTNPVELKPADPQMIPPTPQPERPEPAAPALPANPMSRPARADAPNVAPASEAAVRQAQVGPESTQPTAAPQLAATGPETTGRQGNSREMNATMQVEQAEMVIVAEPSAANAAVAGPATPPARLPARSLARPVQPAPVQAKQPAEAAAQPMATASADASAPEPPITRQGPDMQAAASFAAVAPQEPVEPAPRPQVDSTNDVVGPAGEQTQPTKTTVDRPAEPTAPAAARQEIFDVSANAERIVRAVTSQLQGRHSGSIRLQLEPPGLGAVRVEVSLGEQTVRVLLQPASESAARLLADQLGQLRQSLQAHGLTVDRLEVQPQRVEQPAWSGGERAMGDPGGSRPEHGAGRQGGYHEAFEEPAAVAGEQANEAPDPSWASLRDRLGLAGGGGGGRAAKTVNGLNVVG